LLKKGTPQPKREIAAMKSVIIAVVNYHFKSIECLLLNISINEGRGGIRGAPLAGASAGGAVQQKATLIGSCYR
jgi:hypothetical protein